MSDRNKKKINKTRICISCPNTIGNEPAIFCDSCEKWSHGNCVGLTKQQIDVINETDGAMWFCKQCRPTVKTTIQSGLPNLRLELEKNVMTIKDMVADGIARSESLASETFERIEGIQEACTACESTVTGLKPTLVEVNRKIQQHSNTLTQHKMTYAAKCAATLSEPIEKKASRSIEQILLVENSDSGLANSMDIKKAIAKHFPIKKLIHAFRNSRGKIHLEFDSADTAADIMQNWNKDAMGTDTSVTNPRGKRRQNALIIRGVDIGISEETLAEQISEQLHTDIEKVTIRRFIKKPDNAKMTTVKVDLQERTMLETALANGLFVNQLFFRPTEYIEKTDIHVTRCFNCQKFGHIAPSSKLGQKSGKCAENHNTDSCHQTEQNYKCVNCLEQHSSASKECPVYLKTLEKLYQSRLVPLPKQLQDKIDRLITEHKWPA